LRKASALADDRASARRGGYRCHALLILQIDPLEIALGVAELSSANHETGSLIDSRAV
jgi:hypothetical protein